MGLLEDIAAAAMGRGQAQGQDQEIQDGGQRAGTQSGEGQYDQGQQDGGTFGGDQQGGLGGALGGLAGMAGAGAGGGMIGAILGALQSRPGGLGGLLSSFQQAGMGSQASSWVQNGPNQDVSPDQVQSALGGGFVEQIASKLGVPPGMAAGALAQYLPQIVDHLTPGGQMPQDGGMGGLGGLLGRLGQR